MPVETRYARSGDVSIAYQVVGHGPIDLVFVMGWVSNMDYYWEEPRFARFLQRLASFSRLILFDKRGTGLSDRVAEVATLEERMDDVRAVMDAVGSEQAALLGVSEGGPMCALFAATYPERTRALLMIGGYARRLVASEYPWGVTLDEWQSYLDRIERDWGGPVGIEARAPSLVDDTRFRQWWATYLRMSASPGAALAYTRMNTEIDVRQVLPAIRVPTLFLHRRDDHTVPVGAGRHLANQIAGARYVELPGADHLPFVGDQDEMLAEIEAFLTGVRPDAERDSVLATLLAAEIVGATTTAAHVGDRRWQETRTAYEDAVRSELARYRGQAVRWTGEGVIAAFDGPARAIHCADALCGAAQLFGLDVRAGLHTGECQVTGDDLAGVALRIAADVATQAPPGAVYVSRTVKDLVAGSGRQLEEVAAPRSAELPGEGRLYRLVHSLREAATARAGRIRPDPTGPGPAHLSRREREVAVLVADGRSNREIAEELVVSIATAERHVANILTKLGFHSRARVAAWAVEEGLSRSE